MAFDPDHDLVSDFNDLIGGKKKGKPIDFEFSESNAKTLDLGFSDTISDKDPIAVGHKRVVNPDGRRKQKKPLRKGANFIKDNL